MSAVERLKNAPWRLWFAQLRSIVGMEYRRNLFSRRALCYFSANSKFREYSRANAATPRQKTEREAARKRNEF